LVAVPIITLSRESGNPFGLQFVVVFHAEFVVPVHVKLTALDSKIRLRVKRKLAIKNLINTFMVNKI